MKIILIVLLIFIILLAVEAFLATLGKRIQFKNPSHEPLHFGTRGSQLTYLILGDSTSAGEGGDYDKGIAVSTANYLARDNKITLINKSISGAKTTNVLHSQINDIEKIKPDIVLIVVGSNDVIGLTRLSSVREDLTHVIDKIIATNCHVKIVLTGSADMGTVPRFYPPLSMIATFQSKRVNNIVTAIANEKKLTFAPIAQETGPIFMKDRSLFAFDRFHPNNRGYAIWIDVVNHALDKAHTQASHCN